ncbi:MAG: ModD protein [Pseudomonadota bacterium]|nr:ModD protein [Pseudomonadota bacterium]
MIFLDDTTLLQLLKEDAPYGDLTSRSLRLRGTQGQMRFQARNPMTVCGVEEAARLLTLLDCMVDTDCISGDRLESQENILQAQGDAEQLLLGWKVTQTLMEWASGVATQAHQLVNAARAVNPQIVIACTRKTIPGTRTLSTKAVLAGGATLHRTGLSDSVLLFPEHRNLAEGADILAQQIATLKQNCPERSVVVEVLNRAEASEAHRCGADVLQLEKFTPEQIIELITQLPSHSKVAAAGGITAANVADYAQTGAQVLVTSAPYYAQPADVKVTIE